MTDLVKNHPNVTVLTEEVTEIPEGPTVIATGPAYVRIAFTAAERAHGRRVSVFL